MDGSHFPESMDALTRGIISGLRERLGSAVGGFTVTESRDQPTPWLTLECTVYEFLPLSFTYDRGICGFSVDYGRRKVPLARPRGHGLGSAEGLGVFLDDVIVAARERIPDKFLDARGW